MARNTQVAADHHAPPVTDILARFVAGHPSRGWSDAIDHEAHRTFINWVGCAVGAAHHDTARAALAAVQALQPAPQAALLGRRERVDMASAALVNGISSHTFDFDDTHLKTIIHPAGPVASALLALAEHTGASGRALIDALVLGIDVSCRVGNAMYPDHYDRGWHITGSTGSVGAAAACARLLGLDAQRTAMALGIAASQPVGMREQFGTMTKPFHPGGAARAGLMAALMAQHGFTASPRALEAPRGMMQTISTRHAAARRCGTGCTSCRCTATARSAPTATRGAAASCRRCRCRGACGPAASSSSARRCAWAMRASARHHRRRHVKDGRTGRWCS
jgi:2-methylcitrate dehydratase PrpD